MGLQSIPLVDHTLVIKIYMIKNAFIDVRDFVYIWLMNDYNEAYAIKEHRFRIGVFWIMYYMGLALIISLCIPNSVGGVIFSPKLNAFQKLIGGFIAFIPYYLWLKWYLYPMLNNQPIDLEFEKSSLKQKKWKTISLFISGFISILIVGLISNLIRFGHV